MLYIEIKEIEDSGNLEEAKNLYYEEIQRGNVNYYLSGFFRCCKALSKYDDFISCFESIPFQNIEEDYLKNQYAWVLYNQQLKNTEYENIDELLIVANKIINTCIQPSLDEYNVNPYVLTVIKVIRKLKEKNNPNYKLIKEWILKLDLDKLKDDNEFRYKDADGIDRENPSHKEFYIQTLSKCYEKLGEDKNCVDFCKYALSLNIKWHYNNKRWINARMLYCECNIADDFNVALEKYKKIVIKNKFWYMYHKLSKLYFQKPDLNLAILFECYALDIREEPQKLVNVMEQLALLFQAIGKIDEMKKFAQASYYYRNLNHWNVSEELQYIIEFNGIDTNIKPNIFELKQICNNVILDNGKTINIEGKIKNYLNNGFSGFIISKQLDKNVFFNVSDIIDKDCKPKTNDFVNCCVIKTDRGLKAIKIQLKGVKHGRNNNK